MSEDASLPVPADKTATPAPDFYAELAATLHGVADDIATLVGRGDLPERWYVGFNMQPLPHDLTDDAKAAAIDAVGEALLGKPGAPQPMSGGTWHHHVEDRLGSVRVAAYSRVASPEERAQRAEAERLRAELEEMRAERDRLAAQQRGEVPESSDGEADR
jgi:hypothetical protein